MFFLVEEICPQVLNLIFKFSDPVVIFLEGGLSDVAGLHGGVFVGLGDIISVFASSGSLDL